uniref:SMB domain-containing protein n=1 Tax=Neogobius melanostomus TaxID=47308 RepID=A0A8C6TZ68_9GOBI
RADVNGRNRTSCLSLTVVPQTSCRGRCYEPFEWEVPGCRCDSGCNNSNSCCFDFDDICTQPAAQWECTRLRCGEKRLPNSNCHCSDDCAANADCCSNYNQVCKGTRHKLCHWVCWSLLTLTLN